MPQGSFIMGSHKLDSKTYALERIEEAPDQYVTEFYTSYSHKNFLKYLTCWEELESIPVKPPVENNGHRTSKKKHLNLQAFLSRKKIDQSEQQGLKSDHLIGK